MNSEIRDSEREQLRSGLLRLGLALKTQSWKRAMELQLTPTQGDILLYLASRSADGARLGTLATALAISSPTTSDAVSALIKKGYVEKAHDPSDSRAVRLRLSQVGVIAAARFSHWSDFLLTAADHLSANEQLTFYRCLVKFIRGLQLAGAIPVARLCITCKFFRPFVHDDNINPHHCGYVDAAFGDGSLRSDCSEHRAGDPESVRDNCDLIETRWRALLDIAVQESVPPG